MIAMASRFDHLGAGHAYAPGAEPDSVIDRMSLFEMGVDGPVLILLGIVLAITVFGMMRFAGARRHRFDRRALDRMERRRLLAERARTALEPKDLCRSLLRERMR